ncbi:MAG: type II toxin-antitoxin system RelE/ParE family toxin [Deltaproteobacteria bacterium]|jgi:phage-related protein|nr:type II toxin-antitoxin system RelE/ParE family toxin [Deltaproteobacteria bacterium]MCL5880518.1 type II toxin-antitoxin system RelE/ParE family toxin [Deltaproteobacteria bacterium]MDA8304699.1 type II toxin-antitoxin system RelE/ParE family toxin [Deltaproteobacteria bacterium]
MNILYFVDERGDSPVREFIDELPLDEQAKIHAYIDELRKQGHNLRRPLADYVKDGIYELRPKANRLFYFFFLKENIVFVHAIKKKTNEIPEKDITLSLKRKKFIEEYQANIIKEENYED